MKEFRQAAADGDLPKLRELYDTGAVKNLNESGSSSERTALHWAAYHGHMQIVRYLIDLGAHVDVQDKEKNTPFNLVIQSDRVNLTIKLDIMQLFITKKANPIISNSEGRTPLMNIATCVRGQGTLNQQIYLRSIIHRIKEIIAEKAATSGTSVAIRPDGSVVFDDPGSLLSNPEYFTPPESGVVNFSILEGQGTSQETSIEVPYHP